MERTGGVGFTLLIEGRKAIEDYQLRYEDGMLKALASHSKRHPLNEIGFPSDLKLKLIHSNGSIRGIWTVVVHSKLA